MAAKNQKELAHALIDAAQAGDVEKIKSLLAAGVDVETKDEIGFTALMYAADNKKTGAVEAVKLLLGAGADANANSAMALMCAAANENADAFEMVKLLLAAGADVNAQDSRGGTALMSAVVSGNARTIEIIKLLLDAGADVNAKTETGMTALMGVFLLPHANVAGIAKLLLDAGADVGATYKNGATALMFAAGSAGDGAAESVKLLLDAGADANAQNACGGTPLMCAAGGISASAAESVKLLLDAGAKVDAKNENGWTPLMFAREQRKKKIVELLRSAGADEKGAATAAFLDAAQVCDIEKIKSLLAAGVDVNVRGRGGETALMSAVESGGADAFKVVKLLLSAGADVAAVDGEGEAALIKAAERGLADIAALLLDAGADANTKVEGGWLNGHTALMAAARCKSEAAVEIVSLLLILGADVNAKDGDGETALSFAKGWGRKEVVRLLQEAGAVDSQGDDRAALNAVTQALSSGVETIAAAARREILASGLIDAAQAGDAERVKALLAIGADVNAKNKDGKTALDMAGEQGNEEIIRLLLEAGAE